MECALDEDKLLTHIQYLYLNLKFVCTTSILSVCNNNENFSEEIANVPTYGFSVKKSTCSIVIANFQYL